jgi:hypothetical protein
MVEINDYIKASGTFLKAENVNEDQNSLWEITAEGEVIRSEKFQVDRLHLPVKTGDKEFIFDASKTNAKFIADKLETTDTSQWVGKHLLLETYKTKTSDGKLVEAINVKDVK